MSRSSSTSNVGDEGRECLEVSEEEDKKQYAPFSASLFDADAETTKRRTAYLRTIIPGCILVICVIFAVLGIYWGSLWKVNQKIHNLNGWIVDFDGGTIGQTFTQVILNNTGAHDQISWQVIDSAQFVNGPSDLEDIVVDERCWVAVSINPGATANLTAAIEGADGSYDGSLAVTAYVVEARNENSYAVFIQPIVSKVLTMASKNLAVQNTQQIASNGALNLSTLLAAAPNVVVNPAYFTVANVRPFDIPVATAVDFVGLIYLLIIAFIISMMNFNARTVRSGLADHLNTPSLLVLRILSPLTLYFFVSWFYALLSLAFKTPFNRQFGHSGFIIFWAMNWMGMSALGLAMEAMITILTPAFAPFFLVLWIIVNVSVCFYPIELLPAIFRYGYAMPFYNVSRTVRTIVFRTRNEVGLNFGVQFAWISVSLLTIPIFQYFMRQRAVAICGKQKETENKVA